jgi:hypothetical protein
VIAHSKNRDEVEKALVQPDAKDIMCFYKGDVPIDVDEVILYGNLSP